MAKPNFLRTSMDDEFGSGFVNVANILRVYIEPIPHNERVPSDQPADLNTLDHRIMAAISVNTSTAFPDGTIIVEPDKLMLFTGTKEACAAYHDWLESQLDVMVFPADQDAHVTSLKNVVQDTRIVLRRLHNNDIYAATLAEVYHVFVESTDDAPAKELVRVALEHLVFHGHVMEYADDGDGIMYRLLEPFVDDTLLNEVIGDIRTALNTRHHRGIEKLSLDAISAEIERVKGSLPEPDLLQHAMTWLQRRGYVIKQGNATDATYQLVTTYEEE